MCNSYIPLTVAETKRMNLRHVRTDYSMWEYACSMIGKKVLKHSGKPFKSTLKTNTCTGIIRNPNTNLWALTFAEDDSVVDVKQLKLDN